MNTLRLLAATGCVAALTLASSTARPAEPSASSPAAPEPFALVELFTSDGCSSCPAADWLLAKIVAAGRERKERLYPLAFHVDLWDHLGWVDSYGSPAYTQRQQDYARVFAGRGVYTPQMVVNGTEEFVGSNWWRARTSLTKAMNTPARVSVVLHPPVARASGLEVGYDVAGAPPGAVLHVAVVERGLVERVLRGENAGRTLHHENVVRAFGTVPVAGRAQGRMTLKPAASVVWPRAMVIGFVQDQTTMAILGATGCDLDTSEKS